jgi:acetyl esterase/lipase
VVFLHGGGFLRGSPDDGVGAALARRLAGSKWAVTCATYRLGATAADLPGPTAADVAAEAARSRRAGVALAPRLLGPAFAAALDDAAAALRDLRAGRALRDAGLRTGELPAAGLPVAVFGVSAGGILALALRWPPARLAQHGPPPDATIAVAAALTQPWRLTPGGPPAILFHGARDRIVPPAVAQVGARRARARGAPLQVLDTGTAGHNAQVGAVLDGHDPAGRPWFDRVAAMLAAAAPQAP